MYNALLLYVDYNYYDIIITVDIFITSSGDNTAGETYSLVCSTVSGSTDITWLDPMNNPVPSGMVTTTGSMSTLTFNPLAASHVGTYTCRATIGGTMQTETVDIIVKSEKLYSLDLYAFHMLTNFYLHFRLSPVPVPTSVSVTSNPVSPIRPVGSNVTLTCTVELSPAVHVDVPVIVNTVWTGPDGVTLSPTTPSMENLTRYTSTAMVNSFGRDQSGNYTCTATVSSTSLFLTDSGSLSGTGRVTVGKNIETYKPINHCSLSYNDQSQSCWSQYIL